MKYFYFLLFSIIVLNSTLFGQDSDPVIPRIGLQSKFIINEFILIDNKPTVNNTMQMDSLYTSIDKLWKSFVKDSLSEYNNVSIEALNNLDSYSYLFVLLSLNRQAEKNNEMMSHLYENYMLPSLIGDYQIIKTNQSLNYLKLLWDGSLGNTIAFGAKYYRNDPTSESFYELYTNLKKLMISFEASDNESEENTTRILNSINAYKYEIEAKRCFFNNQPNLSFTYLISGIATNKFYKTHAITFGKDLIEFFQNSGENDKSIAILNNLFIYTTNDELPRDTLLKWYTSIDSKNGQKFYEDILSKFSTNYFEETKNNTIELPQVWNIIANSVSDEKIKNAKYILIDFWYSSCTPCIAEIPRLNELYSSIENQDNVIFISINADLFNGKKDKSYVELFAEKYNINFPMIYDNDQTNFIKQFNVNGYPSKYIVNKHGGLIMKKDKSKITLSTFYDFIEMHQ